MTTANADIHPTACPRCRSGTIQLLGKSPDAGIWTVFGCSTCFYAWRSTEAEENVNPEKYPLAFRLRPEDLANLRVVPTVQPRRSSS
jgi:vanillate/4-hydroxybenzoate decarboxylase subunit D